jgi:hypothetical protein
VVKQSSYALLLAMCFMSVACVAGGPETPSTNRSGHVVTKPCGGSEVTLQCSPDSVCCTKTTLTLKTKDGKSVALDKPKGMSSYTGVGLACSMAKDNTPYFVIQYGELPTGCEFCEWFYLYTEDGKLLTHSDPAILTDASLPEAHQQYPNNKEYRALSKQLGLGRPKMQFIP